MNMKEDWSGDDEINMPGKPLPPYAHAEAPEGYFDRLPENVITRWKAVGVKQRNKFIWVRRMSVAASVVLLCGIYWWMTASSNESGQDDITGEEAYAYVMQHIDEFDGYLEEAHIILEEEISDVPMEDIEEYLQEEYENGSLRPLY